MSEPPTRSDLLGPKAAGDAGWKSRLAYVVLQQLFAGAGFAVFSLMPKFLVRALHATDAEVGLISAGMPGGALLFSPLLAYVLDRYPRVRILRTGLALFVVVSIAIVPLARERALLLPLALVLGGSMVMVFNTAGAIAAEIVPREHIARAVGLHGASNMLGYALAPAVAEIVAERYGWTPTFTMACVMGLAAMLVTFLIDEPARVTAEPIEGAPSVGMLIAPFAVASMACGIAHFALYVFHQPHIFAQGGTEVRGYFIGFTVGALVMRLVFGGISDQYGHARVATISLFAYALVAFGAAFMTPRTLEIFGFAQGLVHGVFYPAVVALGVERAGHAAKGRAITWLYGTFNLGSMLAGLVGGAIAEAYDTRVAFYVTGLVTGFGVLALVPSFTEERRRRLNARA